MDELRDKLAFLSTPYTLFPAGHYAAFLEACKLNAALLKRGITTYSPILYTHGISYYGGLDPVDYEGIWRPFNDVMLRRCDVLIVARMQGWRTSEGMMIEQGVFEVTHRPIYDLDPVTTELTKREPQKPPRDRIDGWSEEEIKSDRDGYLSEQRGA